MELLLRKVLMRNSSGRFVAVDPYTRFISKVNKTATCWIWNAGLDRDGYGRFRGKNSRLAHRFSYEHHYGAIDENLEIDHLCRNRACVNPQHLEVVEHKENMKRMVKKYTLDSLN